MGARTLPEVGCSRIVDGEHEECPERAAFKLNDRGASYFLCEGHFAEEFGNRPLTTGIRVSRLEPNPEGAGMLLVPPQAFEKIPGQVTAWQTPCEVLVKTMEGELTAPAGAWIVHGDANDVWPVQDDIFRSRYRPV